MDTNVIVIILETFGLFCLIIFGAYLIAPRKSEQKDAKSKQKPKKPVDALKKN